MYDVTVIGAGVIGAMIARGLAKYELRICILEGEHDVATGASRANSAIVHAGLDAKPGTLKARLNVRGAEMMERLAKELGVPYRRNGSLVLGIAESDRDALGALLERGVENGVPGLRLLEREQLLAIEPNLSEEALCALYAPSGAIVCPYELTVAAVGNAMDNGAALLTDFRVEEIREEQGGYTLRSGERTVESRFVINAAGVHADEVARLVGDTSFTLRPRRGEYLLMDRESGECLTHTVFRVPSSMGKGILVTPTVDGNLLVGPTSEDQQDRGDRSTTADGLAHLMREAVHSVKNIPFRNTITSFCGLRAVGDTGDFIIRSPKRGFLNVAGIESPGLSASPAIAEYVEAQLSGMGLALVPRSDWEPRRRPIRAFREGDADGKNQRIREDGSYGRIICRCEGITEGEILEAIRRNPPARDLDGIKRRTRAQMGRCQGGFCGPQILAILARELGVPPTEITKSGGNSHLLLRRNKSEDGDRS